MTHIPKITLSKDGSPTLFSPLFNEHYHSFDGALQESQHVFIDHGLAQIHKSKINVFEMGFGSGLNAWLSYYFAKQNKRFIHYYGIEKYPLSLESATAYSKYLQTEKAKKSVFLELHKAAWNTQTDLNAFFSLSKYHDDILHFKHAGMYDIVLYDAFSYHNQPELWSTPVFEQLYNALNPGGLLCTYASKGEIKRNLRSVGFEVKRLPGAGQKHHMLNAWKL